MMIKRLRDLTRLLGKLGVTCLISESWEWKVYQQELKSGTLKRIPFPHRVPNKWSYGVGLKEAKDMVESYIDSLHRKARATTT